MNSRSWIWIGMFIGSFIGGAVPNLWGAGAFSFASVILTAVGGILGVWAGFKLSKQI